jgi:hypothetical protein
MFHFTGYRVPFPILFRKGRRSVTPARLPHSEISGSTPLCGSPKLIAAYHVLHRLLAPRHSLCALKSLIPSLCSKSLPLVSKDLLSQAGPFCRIPPDFIALGSREPRTTGFRRWLKSSISKNRSRDQLCSSELVCSFAVRKKTNFLFSMWMSKSGLPFPINLFRFLRFVLRRVVGQTGLEPVTPRLSSVCSNQLSYRPSWIKLVEVTGFEPMTSCLQSRRSTN